MVLVVFNAFLYLILFLVHWVKKRKFGAAQLLLSVYLIISIACVIYYALFPNEWNLQLWSFIYLFVISLLFFRPVLFDSDILIQKLHIRNYTILNLLAIVYFLSACISIYFSLPNAIENINIGTWKLLRLEVYQFDLVLYENQLHRVAEIFSSYLRHLAIIIMFFYLTRRKSSIFWISLLAIGIIVPLFSAAINTASRGMIIHLFVSLAVGYIIFRQNIIKPRRDFIKFGGTLLLALFLFYSIIVTKDRFGVDDYGLSILAYFGHSMLTFNYGLADSIHTFLYGEYFFSWFYESLGVSYNVIERLDTLGAHFETGFFTFVGAWYIDFGPFGTLLIAILLPILVGGCFRGKKKIDIADIYIYTFYMEYLIMGVFVVGAGSALNWLIAFVIYGLLKTTTFEPNTRSAIPIRTEHIN